MSNEDSLTVVLCGDSGIAKPTAVTVRSLVQTAAERSRLNLVCLTTGWTEDDRRFVVDSAEGANIRCVDVGQHALPLMHKRALVPPSAYLRFLIPQHADGARAIYLDSDILVRRSLDELFSADLDGSSTGACRASSTPFVGSPGGVEGWRELGIDPRNPALNSGVLVLDLNRWREKRIGERALELAGDRGASFRLADQAVLNTVLDGDWKELHPRWNATTGVFDDDKGWFAVDSPERLDEAASDPAIVHFTGPRKPWRPYVDRPFAGEWREIATAIGWTPWLDPPALRVRLSRLKKRLVH